VSRLVSLLIALGLLIHPSASQALDATGLRAGMSYQEASTWHEQFMEGERTKQDIRASYREMIRNSPVGERGLQRIYRNFSADTLDPTIPGVDRTIRMQYSGSPQQRKGYRREWLYADAIYRDRRFTVVALDQPSMNDLRRTDKDLVLRHAKTNTPVRVEVKDVSLKSQIRNQAKLKLQIDGMALEHRRTGEKQVWINRRPVSTAISAYGVSRGVVVLGNVATGSIRSPTQVPIARALDVVDRSVATSGPSISRARGFRVVFSGAQIGAGVLLLYESAPTVYAEAIRLQGSSEGEAPSWLSIAEHGSTTLAGGTMVVSGGALLGGFYASEAVAGSLGTIGQWGGVTALGLLLTAEGFNYARYHSGEISSREFWTRQWILGASLGGATLGSWIGGSLGVITIGEPTIFSTLGGFLGAVGGNQLGRTTARWYYDWKFAELDEAFGAAVYARYGPH
jgi:hypothetical protein